MLPDPPRSSIFHLHVYSYTVFNTDDWFLPRAPPSKKKRWAETIKWGWSGYSEHYRRPEERRTIAIQWVGKLCDCAGVRYSLRGIGSYIATVRRMEKQKKIHSCTWWHAPFARNNSKMMCLRGTAVFATFVALCLGTLINDNFLETGISSIIAS